MSDVVVPLPQNPTTERELIGGILVNTSALPAVSKIVVPDDFSVREYCKVFSTLQRFAETGKPLDWVTLWDELKDDAQIIDIGGAAFISSLGDGVHSKAPLEHYAKMVHDAGRLRRLAYAGESLQRRALEPHAKADEVQEYASALASSFASSTSTTSQFQMVNANKFLERSSEDEKPWLAKELLPACSRTIWQGRPKVGKSHSLLQLAFDLACGLPVFGHFAVSRPVRCAYFELEEPECETKGRYASMLRAHDGQGPDCENLHFYTREDLHQQRLLPRELLGAHLKDCISALRDAGSEFIVLIALRKFLGKNENLKDPEVAERVNDALDAIRTETGAAIALANHNRKQEADTVEAQGFGSTFISADADASFDIDRAKDGLRRIRAEGRFGAPDQFFLRKEPAGAGELITWSEAPLDPKDAKRKELQRRVDQGDSVRKAAEALDIAYATAKRWISEGGSPAQ